MAEAACQAHLSGGRSTTTRRSTASTTTTSMDNAPQAQPQQNSSNVLQLIPVPHGMCLGTTTYGELFEALSKSQLLPLGLYRRRKDRHDQTVEFVSTNPDKATVLTVGDRVYVLGAQQGAA